MSRSDHPQLQPSKPANVYDDHYYKNYPSDAGVPYERLEVWLNFFAHIAEKIIEHINPGTVLDVGCAKGFLVEALRDRGIKAFGLDISEYAIKQIREDIKPFCWNGSAVDFSLRYFDLIVCIEVLEHLSETEAQLAVANLCEHTHDVLFSSSPDSHPDPTHLNVQPIEYWAGLFANHGFYRDADFDASFIAPHAVRFRKSRESFPFVVKTYERKLWQQWIKKQDLESRAQALKTELTEAINEKRLLEDQLSEAAGQLQKETRQRDQVIACLRASQDEKETQILSLTTELEEIKRSLGFELLCRYGAIKTKWLPNGSRRRAMYDFIVNTFKAGMKDGSGIFLKTAAVKVRSALYAPLRVKAKTNGNMSSGEQRPRYSWGNAVLIISGSGGNMERYRCHHTQEQLQLRGVRCDIRHMNDPKLPRLVGKYDLVILHRVPYLDSVENLVRQSRQKDTLVLLDMDDLVFDIELVPRIDALRVMDEVQRQLYLDGVRRYRRTVELCDGALVATEYLVEAISKLGKPAWIHRNALSNELIRISEEALLSRRPPDGKVIIGYASGTRTHNRDFKEAQTALQRILHRYPQAELQIVGDLDLDESWENWQHRMKRLRLVDWGELPKLISQFDINLAPLELGNPFCEAKSELKYFEAGILGVPTVASRTRSFEFAIRHNDNGMLAANEEGWFDALDRLVSDQTFRLKIGSLARQDVLRRYHPSVRGRELVGSLDIINRSIRGYGGTEETNERVFGDHALAHDLLDGLTGLEIGAAAHNPFGLQTRNVVLPEGYDFYIAYERQEMKLEPVPVHIWASADNIPVSDRSEDFIISSHVVEHLPNVIGAFQEWNRIVKRDGYIFMIVPQKGALPEDASRALTSLSHLIEDYQRARPLPGQIARYLWQKFYATDGWFLERINSLSSRSRLKAYLQILRDHALYGKVSLVSVLHWLLPWNTHSIEGVPGGKSGHYHTFTPDSLLEAVNWMRSQHLCNWDLVGREDVDSKVGNGFTLVFKVR